MRCPHRTRHSHRPGDRLLLLLTGEITQSPTDTLLVDFAHTGNVVKNAPVKLAGVGVGKVERIELFPGRVEPSGTPLPVRMTLSISGVPSDNCLSPVATITLPHPE